ncbi:hypothetical protein EV1_000034 [Malus domestica]
MARVISRNKGMVQQQQSSKDPKKRVENKVDYPGVKDIPRNTPHFQNTNFREQTNPYAKPRENMCYKCGSHGQAPAGAVRQ